MRTIVFIPLAFLLLAACGSRKPQVLGPEEYKSASGAAKTVEIVANDPAMVSLPDHATILRASAGNLKTALQIEEATPETVGAPLVTGEELVKDAPQAAVTAMTEAAKRDAAVIEEQKASWFDNVLEWGGWGAVGGAALLICRLLGVPGVQYLSDPLVRMIGKPWISKIEQHEAELQETIGTLWSTVEGSMAGRGGLAILDKLIGDKIAEDIKRVTQGQASSLEGLFKWLAKAHVMDGKQDQHAVNSLLDDIKNQMDTTNGLPSSVVALLGQAISSFKA